jgi:hypothetical protein
VETVRCPVYLVRRAVRASVIEIQDYRYTGDQRRCAAVGRFMLRVGVPTISTAVFRHGR